MEIQKSGKQAVLLGATGLVGEQLLQKLLSHQAYDRVRVVARNASQVHGVKKLEWVQDPMTDWSSLDHLIKGDDLFISIGTTIKKAGNKEAFRKVDHDLVFHMAKAGALNGMSQLLLVSSVGADKNSFFFYSRVKGEIEEAVTALPFWAVHIFRPSMLLGHREESRPMEFAGQRIFAGVDKIIGDHLGKYRPVSAEKVARSMVYSAQQLKSGRYIHPSDEIYEFTDSRLLKE